MLKKQNFDNSNIEQINNHQKSIWCQNDSQLQRTLKQKKFKDSKKRIFSSLDTILSELQKFMKYTTYRLPYEKILKLKLDNNVALLIAIFSSDKQEKSFFGKNLITYL